MANSAQLEETTCDDSALMRITESDWKKFGPLREKALDRLFNSILREVTLLTTDETKASEDRYRKLYDLVEARDKKVGKIFDGYSRGGATIQLCLMAANGLVTDEELVQFSEEMQNAVQDFVGRRGA